MRLALAALSLFPVLAFAEISITGPSSSAYWVQNTSNTITWSFGAGDPNPVSIIVTNKDNTTLNGAFSIAESVNVSQASFTTTNVTLRPGSNYQVVFVNSTNLTQVYANSTDFDVKPAGTTPAPTASSGSGSGSASATGTGSSASGSASSTSSTSSAPRSSSASLAIRLSLTSAPGTLHALGACGLAALAGLLL
ncbi:hypothetical protein HETIRDRAFT_411851 [Heterobasidion irregulare TC 32-1]|uniref:Yeast cell wall synthesis Kre9/Knh1-like N-terminal domain-containing protein n=1 Tax=Heterobasidion irregulare (strain TC 32-1) TaxID=747525 RepID=W4JS98_HETIT|nr:uncharacterized protein HETIRDRAFT_411851 [Heterobasidion irregulare TC 32-1]ETW76437.1 hypothetical protein HETIRDRAFT_411851 [Heterobasidion irregulare TC 32-1]